MEGQVYSVQRMRTPNRKLHANWVQGDCVQEPTWLFQLYLLGSPANSRTCGLLLQTANYCQMRNRGPHLFYMIYFLFNQNVGLGYSICTMKRDMRSMRILVWNTVSLKNTAGDKYMNSRHNSGRPVVRTKIFENEAELLLYSIFLNSYLLHRNKKWVSSFISFLSHIRAIHSLNSLGIFRKRPVSIPRGRIPYLNCAQADPWLYGYVHNVHIGVRTITILISIVSSRLGHF